MKRALFSLILAFLLPTLASAGEIIDLRQAVRLALERNLNLQAQTYNTLASEAQVRRGYGLYDPLLGANIAVGESRDQTLTVFPEAVLIDREVDFQRGNLSLGQRLPWGTDLQVEFLNSREKTDPAPSMFDPLYRSELRFSLAQPLLRNFGREVTEQQILFAIHDREISIQGLRENAFFILAEVRDTYFDVLRFRENVAYRQRSVDLASRVLAENRARVEAGVLAPVEILEAEVGLLTRQRELLDAERIYEDTLDRLALLVQSPEGIRVAAETLGLPALAPDESRGFQLALERRPDLLRRNQEIERQELQRRLARNRTLPAVDLVGRYGHRGIADSYGSVLEDVGSADRRNWEIGLNFSYPLGNREARNDVARTRLQQRSLEALQAQLRDEIRTEIRNAIRLLEVSEKRVEVTRRGVALAEEKLRTLLRRQEVGLATTRQVLEGEEDLALAQTELTASLADYNKAATGYLRVTGQLLEHEGVYFAGPVDPRREEPLLRITQ